MKRCRVIKMCQLFHYVFTLWHRPCVPHCSMCEEQDRRVLGIPSWFSVHPPIYFVSNLCGSRLQRQQAMQRSPDLLLPHHILSILLTFCSTQWISRSSDAKLWNIYNTSRMFGVCLLAFKLDVPSITFKGCVQETSRSDAPNHLPEPPCFIVREQ